jgi:hypothetical protein
METINRIAEVVERRNIGFLDVGAIPTASTIGTLPNNSGKHVELLGVLQASVSLMGANRFDGIQ